MKPPATVIRASSLGNYSDCHRRGAARIFRKEIEAAGYTLRDTPVGIGAGIGTAAHVAAKVSLDEKARSGANPPLSLATDATVQSLRETIKLGVRFDKLAAEPNRAEQQALSITETYQHSMVPRIEPILAEQRLEAQVSNDIVLSGTADQICREPGSIRDLKTGIRRGHHKVQLSAYSLLARSHGIDIHHAYEDFIKRCGPRTPQAAPVSYSHDLEHGETAAIRTLARIAADIKGFREGKPEQGIGPGDPWNFIANPNSVLCSPRYCSAYGTEFCHEWVADTLEGDE